MGYWGGGLFENDYAMDVLQRINQSVLSTELRIPIAWEDVASEQASVFVTFLLCKHCHFRLPDRGLIGAIFSAILDLHTKTELLQDYERAAHELITRELFNELLALYPPNATSI